MERGSGAVATVEEVAAGASEEGNGQGDPTKEIGPDGKPTGAGALIPSYPEFALIPLSATLRSMIAFYKIVEAIPPSNPNQVTVIGHHPEYVELAEEINANKFQIPNEIWEGMTEEERWAANVKFMDRSIKRGDNIRLATPFGWCTIYHFFDKREATKS